MKTHWKTNSAVLFSTMLLGGIFAQSTYAAKGMIKVITNPGDAKLYINGKRKGNSPAEKGQSFALKLSEGEYLLEAIKSKGGMYEDYAKKEIFVAEDSLQSISLKLEKRVNQAVKQKMMSKSSQELEPEMSFVKGSSFWMGSYKAEVDRGSDEYRHKVKLDSFYISKYEVTFDEWDTCVAQGGCSHYPDDKGWGRGKRPVINVSWNDTQEYIKWLNRKTGKKYSLPTEAQWEYAARGGTTTPFSFGNYLSTDQANYDGNYPYNGGRKGKYLKKTVAVGSYPSNAFGLYDMHGNVWEWCQDWYSKNYYKNSPLRNPQGASSGSYRVQRGGGWSSNAKYCRSAYRGSYSPDYRLNNLGFRLLRKQ